MKNIYNNFSNFLVYHDQKHITMSLNKNEKHIYSKKKKRETYNITIKLCGVNFEEEKKLNCLILINLK
jgi:hypothetical protein